MPCMYMRQLFLSFSYTNVFRLPVYAWLKVQIWFRFSFAKASQRKFFFFDRTGKGLAKRTHLINSDSVVWGFGTCVCLCSGRSYLEMSGGSCLHWVFYFLKIAFKNLWFFHFVMLKYSFFFFFFFIFASTKFHNFLLLQDKS